MGALIALFALAVSTVVVAVSSSDSDDSSDHAAEAAGERAAREAREARRSEEALTERQAMVRYATQGVCSLLAGHDRPPTRFHHDFSDLQHILENQDLSVAETLHHLIPDLKASRTSLAMRQEIGRLTAESTDLRRLRDTIDRL